jgi:hypothetical protein
MLFGAAVMLPLRVVVDVLHRQREELGHRH